MQTVLRILRDGAFIVIAALGAVLSIVAVVVVMELHKPKDAPLALSVDKLRASLDSAYRVTEKRHAVPVAFEIDSAGWRVAAAEKISGPAMRSLEPSYGSLMALWEARRIATLAEVHQGAHETALMYGTEAARTGNRDRVVRFDSLLKWHRAETRKADAHLDTARMKLADVNVAIVKVRQARDTATAKAWADTAWTRMQRAHTRLAGSYAFASVPFRKDVPFAEKVQVVRNGESKTITNYHPYASLAAWLRTQGSLELVTVIGMLGFGLLGAAASRVVRRPELEDGKRAPVGDNIANTLLSGVSAALATYLLVQAGLAVASADGATPNPYLLLLTCFVAAVYWEEAWQRVRKAVQGPDASGGEENGEPQNAAGDPPQNPAHGQQQDQPEKQPEHDPTKLKLPGEIVRDDETPAAAGGLDTPAPGAGDPPPAES
jgi:hypothetical protein